MGMSKEEAIRSVEVQGRRELIEQQAGGLNLDENIKSLIANAGTFNEAGQAGYVINGEFQSLETIAGDKGLQEEIKKLNQDEGKDVKDIAQSVRTMEMLMSGQTKSEEAIATSEQYKFLTGEGGLEEIYQNFYKEGGALKKFVGATDTMQAALLAAKQSITDFGEALNAQVNIFESKEHRGRLITLLESFGETAVRNLSLVGGNIAELASSALSPKTKQQGGPIGGLPHSQGGTLIEAELGEYVVNRNAASQFRGLLDEINSYRNPGPISVQPAASTFQQGGEIEVPKYAAGGSVYNASPTINYSSAVSYDAPAELSESIKTAITRAIQEYDSEKKQAEILASGRREY
jgi:hypothetical protein